MIALCFITLLIGTRPHAGNDNAIGTWPSTQYNAAASLFKTASSVSPLIVCISCQTFAFYWWQFGLLRNQFQPELDTIHLLIAMVHALYPSKQNFGPISLFLQIIQLSWDGCQLVAALNGLKYFVVVCPWSQDGVPHDSAWSHGPGSDQVVSLAMMAAPVLAMVCSPAAQDTNPLTFNEYITN